MAKMLINFSCMKGNKKVSVWHSWLGNCNIVSTAYSFYDLDQIFFINIFYAFLLNNFCFFEQANELIHVQIRLTSFIKFTMILNQTVK